MRNHATLRNALRKPNYELPSVSNDMQSSETLRNSLGFELQISCSNQLSYAGIYEGKSRKAKWQQLDVHSWRGLRKILPEANIELTGIWDMEFGTGDPATNYDNGILSVSQPPRPTGFPVYNQPRFLK